MPETAKVKQRAGPYWRGTWQNAGQKVPAYA
jgi:hypothetical protein